MSRIHYILFRKGQEQSPAVLHKTTGLRDVKVKCNAVNLSNEIAHKIGAVMKKDTKARR